MRYFPTRFPQGVADEHRSDPEAARLFLRLGLTAYRSSFQDLPEARPEFRRPNSHFAVLPEGCRSIPSRDLHCNQRRDAPESQNWAPKDIAPVATGFARVFQHLFAIANTRWKRLDRTSGKGSNYLLGCKRG